ncbi:MAG: mannitol dehydrogenase family protein [Anaerolineae bacterium]
MRQKAVIFGAGNVGRGFLGQLFSESGFEVVFVDIDQPLIEALRSRGAYTIRLVSNETTELVRVAPVTGILSGDVTAVAEALSEATIGATAVGARVLPYIAPTLAAGIILRANKGIATPLNLIVCENLKGAASILRGMVDEHLDPISRDYAELNVGFVDTVIGRMVPELSPELRAQDPTLIIVEPYKELPVDRGGFVGEPPDVVGMQVCDNFGLYTARKLYLHNAGHAVLGYLGHLRGYALGYEALEDPDIRAILEGALEESLRGIVAAYGADEDWLRAHVTDLTRRFANRVLADPALRLARDPLRKLAPGDRLVGAARVAESAGVTPTNLAFVIAAGLHFDAPEDPRALEMQNRIAAEGVEAVLESVCEILRAEPLGQAVLESYRRIGEGAPWK